MEARCVPATPRPRRADENRSVQAHRRWDESRPPLFVTGSSPRLRTIRGGTRRSRTCCLPGFNRSLIRMSLSSIASRREESNLHRVDPNHACFRYTTSSRAALRAAASRRCRMASLCSCQWTIAAQPFSGMAAARWEGLEPSSPGLEPGILAGWTTTAHAGASTAPPRELTESNRPVVRACWSHAIRPRQ